MAKGKLKFKPFIDTQTKKNNISFVFSDNFIVPIQSHLLNDFDSSEELFQKLNRMGLLYEESSLIKVSLFSDSKIISNSLIDFIDIENESNGKYKFSGKNEPCEYIVFIPEVLYSDSTFKIMKTLIQENKKVLLFDFTLNDVFIGPLFTGEEKKNDLSMFESLRDRRYLNSINATLIDTEYVSKSKQEKSTIESALNVLRLKLKHGKVFDEIVNNKLLYINQTKFTSEVITVPPLFDHKLNKDSFKLHGEQIVESGSGLRVKQIDEIYSSLNQYVCPVLGILSRIINYDSQYDFSSVGVTAIDILSRGTIASHYGSAGKGSSREHSMVSTIAEAIERSTLVLPVNMDRCVFGKLSEIELTHKVLKPCELEEIHPWQREQKKIPNNKLDIYNLPIEYNDDAIYWVNAHSLLSTEKKLIPAKTCIPTNQVMANDYFVESTSNGLAAGATLEEAIIQGSLEVIERDAFSIWWFNELRLPHIIGLEEKSDYIKGLSAHLKEDGIFVEFLYFKTDFDVHNVFVTGFNNKGANGLVGMGTHFDLLIAAQRALGELAQSRPNKSQERKYCHFSFLNKNDFSFLKGGDAIHIDNISNTKRIYSNTKDAIDFLCNEFRRNGLDLLFTDVSNKLFNLKVVRVISPGTAKHYQRLGCRRLYEVPSKLGFFKKAMNPWELNSLSYINWKVLFYGS